MPGLAHYLEGRTHRASQWMDAACERTKGFNASMSGLGPPQEQRWAGQAVGAAWLGWAAGRCVRNENSRRSEMQGGAAGEATLGLGTVWHVLAGPRGQTETLAEPAGGRPGTPTLRGAPAPLAQNRSRSRSKLSISTLGHSPPFTCSKSHAFSHVLCLKIGMSFTTHTVSRLLSRVAPSVAD